VAVAFQWQVSTDEILSCTGCAPTSRNFWRLFICPAAVLLLIFTALTIMTSSSLLSTTGIARGAVGVDAPSGKKENLGGLI